MPHISMNDTLPTEMLRANPPVLMNEHEVAVFLNGCPRSVRNFTSRKLLPVISPNKTIEGLIGGYFFSVATAMLMHDLAVLNVFEAMALGFGIATCAFFGDFSASVVKRKFGVKDFSALIPGHGGFLDRFDSLIFAGSFMYLIINYSR